MSLRTAITIILLSLMYAVYALEAKIGWTINRDSCDVIVSFIDSSSVDSGDSVIAWEWDFGDETQKKFGHQVDHIINGYGWFDIRLKVHTKKGKEDSSSRAIYLDGPEPWFGFDDWFLFQDSASICESDSVRLFLQTHGYLDSIQTKINWGDGSFTAGLLPAETRVSHVYSHGRFELSMKVNFQPEGTDLTCAIEFPSNRADLKRKRKIIVNARPLRPSDFSIATNPTFVDYPTAFVPILDSIYTEAIWYFGDGDTIGVSADSSPVIHHYRNSGIYPVKLVPHYRTKPFEPVCPTVTQKFIIVRLAKYNSIEVLDPNIAIWPNPASDQLQFKIEGQVQEVVIYNALGAEFLIPVKPLHQNKYAVNVSDLTSGQYYLKIVTDQGIRWGKILVNN